MPHILQEIALFERDKSLSTLRSECLPHLLVLSEIVMKKSALAAVAAICLSASASQASTFTVDYQDPGDPFGDAGLFSWVTIDSEVFDGTYRAGQFAFTAGGLHDFLAFCFEVTQGLRDGHDYQNTPNILSDAVITNVELLFNSAYAAVTDGLTAAGFQVAIWEIVEDTGTGLDLSSGSFSAVDASGYGGVVAQAQSFLDGLGSAATGDYTISFLSSPTSQDVVTADPIPFAPVPLPASGLLLLGTAGLLMRRKSK